MRGKGEGVKSLSLDGRLLLSGVTCPQHVKEDAGGIFGPPTANGYKDLAARCLVDVGEGEATHQPKPAFTVHPSLRLAKR